MKTLLKIWVLLFIVLVACKDDGGGSDPVIPGTKPGYIADRTVIMYLGMDDAGFLANTEYRTTLNFLVNQWDGNYGGRMVVYLDRGGEASLIEIKHKDGKNIADTVKMYTKEESNSADPAIFSQILQDIKDIWPSNSYGLLISSHGTGWLPQNTMASPRSIIDDMGSGGQKMDIKDFANAIPYSLDFIILDACLMGGIEVLYELKDKTAYIVSSTAEVLSTGMLQTSSISYLMKDVPDLNGFADESFKYYDGKDGYWRSMTISVAKTSELEKLAAVCKDIIGGVDLQNELDLDNIQVYGYGRNTLYFDLGDVIFQYAPEKYSAFLQALDECLVYKNTTPGYYTAGWRDLIPVNFYSGLSVYIPQAQFPFINSEYKKMKWTQAINPSGNTDTVPAPIETEYDRTLIVYMGMDDGGGLANQMADATVNMLRDSWNPELKTQVFMYLDKGKDNYLLNIYKNGNKNQIDTLKVYGVENSADPEVFGRVLSEIQETWPTASYGLIVSTHGTGWLPQNTMIAPMTIIIDKGSGSEMDIKDFAEAIPFKLDYLIFDACLMGGIEVAYELKDKADYLLVSPAEVLQEGIIMSTTLGHLGKSTPDLQAVATDFFNYYNQKSSILRSATVALVKTSELDNLAIASKALIGSQDIASQIDITALQIYGYGSNRLYFDFGHTMKKLGEIKPEQYSVFEIALAKTILYKNNTPGYYSGSGGYKNISYFSGLTTYIPQSSFPFLNSEYQKMKWAKKIGNNI